MATLRLHSEEELRKKTQFYRKEKKRIKYFVYLDFDSQKKRLPV